MRVGRLSGEVEALLIHTSPPECRSFVEARKSKGFAIAAHAANIKKHGVKLFK